MTQDLGRHLIHRWNVGDALRRSAARHPDKLAIRFGDTTLTYRDLDRRANQAARVLEDAGIRRGDPVAVLALNSPDFVALFFGAARIGAPLVPVNALLRGREIDYVLEFAGIKALVVDPALAGSLNREGSAVAGVPVRFAFGDRDLPDGFAAFGPRLAAAPDGPVERYVDNEDAATILFTSGTTAFPKAVVNTHLNYYAALLAAVADLEMNRRQHSCMGLPLFHSAGLFQTFSVIGVGAGMTLLPRIEPKALLEAVARDRATTMALPATVWAGLLQLPGIEQADLSSLELLIVFQYLPTEVFQHWAALVPRARWVNYWGQTEMIPLGASTPPELLFAKLTAPDPIGYAHLPVEIRVVDEAMNDVGPGEVGEMVARGPSVTPGYLNDPAATEELFRGGWHHTGDMAFRDADGFLYFVDRKKDMVKSGGENVSSQEVEEVLARHPAVAEVAVFGLPHPYWIEMVAAAVTLKPGATLTEAELIAFARDQMAHFKAPRKVFIVDDLPRSPAGKILKRELRERFAQAAEA
ncbi:MAG: AMP-binding protein [Actinomycetia bacterium]|nr:AMP-binding protein [Actinomycetes bacterium]